MTPRTVVCQPPLSVSFPCKHTGVGCHFLLPEIFPTTQGLNACQLHRQTDSVPEGPGKPRRPPHSVTTPSSWARAGPLTVLLHHRPGPAPASSQRHCAARPGPLCFVGVSSVASSAPWQLPPLPGLGLLPVPLMSLSVLASVGLGFVGTVT